MIQHILVWTLGLWFYYRAVMWLKQRRDVLKTKSKPIYYIAYLFAAVGVVLDIIYNVVVGSIIFLDLPKELTFTSRLKRYRRAKQIDWRWKLATFFCQRMLNPYDPEHC